MSKRRIFFSKTGMGKYISHLDLLRCFARTIQRSGLPVVYSQGFNPHQKMTFALPLPVGVTSECETVDIQFEDTVSDAEIRQKLNQNLPVDLYVLAVETPVYAAAEITAAEYRMVFTTATEVTKRQIQEFFGQTEVWAVKKTKRKGEKKINILDYVHAWEVLTAEEREFTLRVVLDAGGERNLKPEILAKAIENYFLPLRIEEKEMHRCKIFCNNKDGTREVFA